MCECLLRGGNTLVLTKANTPQQKLNKKTNNAASVWSYLKGSLIWHVTQSVSVTSLVYAIVASNRAPELFEWHSPHYGTTSHRHHQVKH